MTGKFIPLTVADLEVLNEVLAGDSYIDSLLGDQTGTVTVFDDLHGEWDLDFSGISTRLEVKDSININPGTGSLKEVTTHSRKIIEQCMEGHNP